MARGRGPICSYRFSVVGVVTVLAGWRFAAVLIWFFLSSSLITKVGTRRKLAVEDGHAVGGQRTAIQVIANGLAGTVAAAATAVSPSARAGNPEKN